MKKTIVKNIPGYLLLASFVLVFASCQKDQNLPVNENQEHTADVKEVNAVPNPSTCTGIIPDKLKVPVGNKLLMETYAKGFQIYQVRRNPMNFEDFEWVFVAPSADVYAFPNYANKLALHYGGPTWEFTKGPFKGEKVVAAKVDEDTPDPTAVSWLLLKTDEERSTPGNQVTYIQRICTTGGLKPNSGANEDTHGQLDSIPYTAVYRFYIKE